jgi:ABC-type nitrate/sulfonate/bicarbonate transport system ATPase subunit
VTVGNTRRDLVEAAYTLGSSDASLVRRVLVPGAAPEIAEILRMVLGWAWTYVIVAELIGASSGIGHMITDSQALLATDQIIFGIIVIGLIGLVSDFAFKWGNRRLFPWASDVNGTMNGPMSILSVRGVERRFDATLALQATDLDVAENDFITILGPSGCGKSTLLRIVAGLDRQTAGDGAARRPAHRRPGRRPRHGVPELHAVPLAHGAATTCASACASAACRGRSSWRSPQAFWPRWACAGFENHYPKQLSGGMQQRTALARALANDPRMLLMDEPFGALDHQTRELMQELLLGIWEAQRKTVLFVTHDIDEAVFMGSRVVVMSARPGRIKLDRPVPLPHPRHYSVKTTPEFAALKAELTEPCAPRCWPRRPWGRAPSACSGRAPASCRFADG